MKRQKGRVLTASVLAAGMALAETVTVNPPAGTVTNAFAFVTDEDVLAVNTGATGGTVHLSPYNTHAGGTTLGSGTLVVAQPVGADDAMGELGATAMWSMPSRLPMARCCCSGSFGQMEKDEREQT